VSGSEIAALWEHRHFLPGHLVTSNLVIDQEDSGRSRVILDDGALRFRKPNGGAVDSVAPAFTQPLGDWTQLPAGTQVNRWAGERMDYGLGVEVLLQQARRGKNVPAGTSC
jgi:hypothetical protein